MSRWPRTLVCFAVKEEARPFARVAAAHPGLRVLITGMGRRNAQTTLREILAKDPPELVISSGFAGGLNQALTTGTVLFGLDTDPALAASLKAAGAQSARFHCADRVVTTTAEKQALRQATAADAVEMESEAIYAVCRERNLLSATVRVILDDATEDLPLDFNQLMTSDQRMSPFKLALALLKAPYKVPALLGLRAQSRTAAQRLADLLARALDL